MKKKKVKSVLCACVLMYLATCVYDFTGLGDYLHTRSFDEFKYPLNLDLKPVIEDVMSGKKPSIAPINYYPHRYLTNSGKCKTIDKLDLFIVVKSAMNHFGHRMAIRQTYGQENFMPGRIVKLLFFLGVEESPKSDTQKLIQNEMADYKDIIQIDFLDSYYNNTIKTMMAFRWVYQHCSTADFYLFTDDDMYISVNNLLEYAHELIMQKDETEPNLDREDILSDDTKETDKHMLAGYVFESAPHRYKTSKWRVSLEEYPWDMWPPYVTAGAYLVSNKSMKVLYIGSLFVKHFRFDDIYIGIVAKKVGIVPTHCPRFHFLKKKYSKDGYKDVIASHGYSDHEELIRVWREQNEISS